MSSSVHDHSSNSDNSGDDESQKQSEPYLQSEFNASEMVHPNMSSSSAEYMVPAHLQIGHAVAQAGYPYPDPYYRSIFAPYGAQPMIHPHTMGMQAAVPLPSDAVEPVYVNAKQYHGIMRRRKSRAKAESENKMLKCRKPYLHESRHLHALKRARGCGGRFLNAKTGENEQNEADSHDKAQSNTGNLDENLNSYGDDINRQN